MKTTILIFTCAFFGGALAVPFAHAGIPPECSSIGLNSPKGKWIDWLSNNFDLDPGNLQNVFTLRNPAGELYFKSCLLLTDQEMMGPGANCKMRLASSIPAAIGPSGLNGVPKVSAVCGGSRKTTFGLGNEDFDGCLQPASKPVTGMDDALNPSGQAGKLPEAGLSDPNRALLNVLIGLIADPENDWCGLGVQNPPSNAKSFKAVDILKSGSGGSVPAFKSYPVGNTKKIGLRLGKFLKWTQGFGSATPVELYCPSETIGGSQSVTGIIETMVQSRARKSMGMENVSNQADSFPAMSASELADMNVYCRGISSSTVSKFLIRATNFTAAILMAGMQDLKRSTGPNGNPLKVFKKYPAGSTYYSEVGFKGTDSYCASKTSPSTSTCYLKYQTCNNGSVYPVGDQVSFIQNHNYPSLPIVVENSFNWSIPTLIIEPAVQAYVNPPADPDRFKTWELGTSGRPTPQPGQPVSMNDCVITE